jgi:hypothetical protein
MFALRLRAQKSVSCWGHVAYRSRSLWDMCTEVSSLHRAVFTFVKQDISFIHI